MARAGREITEKLGRIPGKPGVYLMKARGERVLYVGKAKDLRVRLRSYFRESADLDPRKQAMVAQVRDISTIVTSNELEALALEANLIKQYRPRFNVILRDDKSYPYLRLSTNEPWPCLKVVRRPDTRDGAMYFGPYVPSSSMYEAMKFIKRNFNIRPCRYKLEAEGKGRPCIQHQMGRCPAPCAGRVSAEDYSKSVNEVIGFLKGRRKDLLEGMREQMAELSVAQRYEEAAAMRDRIRSVERAWESQKVIAPELGDLDAFGIYNPALNGDGTHKEAAGQAMMAVVLFIRGGTMIGAREFYLSNVGGAPMGELVHEMIVDFYSKGLTPPPLVLLPAKPEADEITASWLSESAGVKVSLSVPQRGKKRELVKMAADNARAAYEARKGEAGPEATMRELAIMLGLDEETPPRSIGAFDISNLTGTDPVGGYVLWQEGDFIKDAYRHVRPKNTEGIDDYAMMRETVERVLVTGRSAAPDVVAIDGGKGHLEAVASLMDEMWDEAEHGPRPVLVSIAKKPDRVFMRGLEEPVPIGGREAASILMRRIRDEVHRYSVSFHKHLRDKRLMDSPLESIPGIGKKRRLALLKAFRDYEHMRQASVEELSGVDGMNLKAALAVHEALNADGSDD